MSMEVVLSAFRTQVLNYLNFVDNYKMFNFRQEIKIKAAIYYRLKLLRLTWNGWEKVCDIFIYFVYHEYSKQSRLLF